MARRVAATVENEDPLREKLLDAAARVFASKGYSGTKIQDIVKAAGLSSGAVYTRFESKDELLMEAVVTYAIRNARQASNNYEQVGDLLIAMAERQGALSDPEAMQLEAYVAARREPEVAKAMAEARRHWRADLKPIVLSAISDGTVGWISRRTRQNAQHRNERVIAGCLRS